MNNIYKACLTQVLPGATPQENPQEDPFLVVPLRLSPAVPSHNRGFTLIELLVVIAIIAILVAFTVANFVGARQRARDVKKKAELQQLKSALRLYYNDYNLYPGPGTGSSANTFDGCGSAIPPADDCLTTCSGQFAAGGTNCDNVYMKLLPPNSDYVWNYQQMASGDDFCLWVALDNTSDTEILRSHSKCDTICSAVAPVTHYVLCAD